MQMTLHSEYKLKDQTQMKKDDQRIRVCPIFNIEFLFTLDLLEIFAINTN